MLCVGLVVANAASLQVQSGTLGAQVSDHPCSGTAAATAATGSGTTYSAVSIITVPSGCAGKELFLTLLNGSTVLRSGTANVAGSGATTVTFTGTYTATSSLTVQAVVDGWNLPTTWTFTPPVSYPICQVCRLVGGVETARPGSTCTVTGLTVDSYWGTVGSRMANVSIAFSYSGATYPDYFKFTVDMTTATGLPAGWNWATSGTKGGNLVLSPSYQCSSLPILVGSSDPGWGPTNGFQFQIFENRAGETVTCAA